MWSEPGVLVAIAGVAALLVYFLICCSRRLLPPIDRTMEAFGFGVTIAVGIRLMWGAFHASDLCHLVDAITLAHLSAPAGSQLSFGEHTWEIMIGGDRRRLQQIKK